MKKRLVIFGSLFLVQFAFAGSPEFSKQYQDCLKNNSASTVDMVDCNNKESMRQDALLNVAYKNLMANLDAAQKQRLIKAQRAWVQYREAETKRLSRATGGTADAVNSSGFYLEFTAQRVKEFEAEPN